MKPLIIFLSILFSQFVQSQEFRIHKLLPPESKELSDLRFLNEELKGKRVVMLGEMTHMYGNIFEMKARVVEYLHKELGYNTIAIESSMFDLWLMNSRNMKFNPEAFNEAVFSVWSGTAEFQRLVDYIAKNDLEVIGFDPQIINNVPEFVDDFFQFCRDNEIRMKLDEDDFGIAIEIALEEVEFPEEDITYKAYERELQRIIRQIEKLEPSEGTRHWLQLTKSLLASSKAAFFKIKVPYNSERASKNDNFRDAQMADNLLSYLAANPEDKVIVWTDNTHAVKDMSSVDDPVLKDFVPMGFHLQNSLGGEVYSLATLHANDSLLERTTWHQTPILKGSFEDNLRSFNLPYLFVSSSQEAFRQPQKNRLLNFVNFSRGRLDQFHDGYIFLRNAEFPKKKIEKNYPSVDTTKVAKKDFEVAENEPDLFSVRGLIIDARSQEPVPFANVILRDQGLYRITDLEGRFQLNIPEGTARQTIFEISAVGYESRDVSLGTLGSIISIMPSYEQLDEVILTAYGTTPKKVLREAIKKIEDNHPTEPFNNHRYGRAVQIFNDTTYRDIEFVTKDYYEGYRQKYFPEHKLEQVKRNTHSDRAVVEKYVDRLMPFRQNPLQFSSLLHKRKYIKFDLEFVDSSRPEEEGRYIIKFSTDKSRFSYTNYYFPTSYSGEIHINKNDFAIIKMVEKWESVLPEKDMEKYKFWHGEFQGDLKWTQDRVSIFSQEANGKYYASQYLDRYYREKLNLKGDFMNTIYERTFRMYDYSFENLEVLNRDKWKKDSAMDRVEFDPEFWGSINEVFTK